MKHRLYRSLHWVVIGVLSVLLFLLDTTYFLEFIVNGRLTDKTIFSAILMNLTIGVIIFLPLIERRVLKIDDEAIASFLALPGKEEKVTFPVITSFLGEQALGAFLGTVLIFTTGHVYKNFGVYVSGTYCFILFVLSIFVITLSLIRFVSHFLGRSSKLYALAAFLSSVTMFAFFGLGLNLAP
ncbi:MAG: hypothetical protein ACK4GU_16540 [Alishewanella aestuarii]